MWDLVDPPKILDTATPPNQPRTLEPRIQPDPGNFQSGSSPWPRETAPPIHRHHHNGISDPFGQRWLAEHLAKSILERPCDPKLKGRPERVPCRLDPMFSQLANAWMAAEIEDYCARRGRPIVLVEMPADPPTPTPGELLAATMTKLPALPPTAGGLLPAKA